VEFIAQHFLGKASLALKACFGFVLAIPRCLTFTILVPGVPMVLHPTENKLNICFVMLFELSSFLLHTLQKFGVVCQIAIP